MSIDLDLECGVFKDYGQDLLIKELKLFKKTLDKIGVSFFLIGGSCVGLVRDNKFLEHDKDIDVGIFEDVDLESLVIHLDNSGYVRVMIAGIENGKYVWAMKVINNTLLVFEIQVFYRKDNIMFFNRNLGKSAPQHYLEGRLEWDAKLFDNMKTIKCGKEEYLVPTPIEKYLFTTYGNWKIPEVYKDWRYNIKNIHRGWL